MKNRKTVPAAKRDRIKSVMANGSAIGGALVTIFLLVDMVVKLSKLPKIWTNDIPGAWKMLQENPAYIPPTLFVVLGVLVIGIGIASSMYLLKRIHA